MAAKLGQKKKGQKPKAVAPVKDIEKDSNIVLTKAPEEVNVKREKAKNSEKGGVFAFFRKFDPIALTCFIAIMLAGVVVIGAYVNAMYINPDWESPVAVDGDTVKVEYVGSYGAYYDKTGAVIFDTNVKSVNDNSDYTKSPFYTNKTQFSLLEFEIGSDKVVQGFSDAVIGKKIGDVVRVKIAPADGYGVAEKKNFSNAVTLNLGGSMTLDAFNEYASTSLKMSDLTNGKTVTMPNGLTAVINPDGGSGITYQYVGVVVSNDVRTMEVDSNVKFKVTSVSGNQFTITYEEPTERLFKAVMQDGTGEKIVYVDNFDNAEVYKYKSSEGNNSEQKGEYLYFWIKIVDVNGYDGA